MIKVFSNFNTGEVIELDTNSLHYHDPRYTNGHWRLIRQYDVNNMTSNRHYQHQHNTHVNEFGVPNTGFESLSPGEAKFMKAVGKFLFWAVVIWIAIIVF